MKQLVLSIKDINVLREVKDTLLHNLRKERRSYIIFQASGAILFRVSDVLALRHNEIYKIGGDTEKNAYIRDRETGKPNTLCLRPVKQDPVNYFNWLNEQNTQSEWLFPFSRDRSRYIAERQFHKIMARTGDLLGISYLGTHSTRKTGAHRIYTRTHYNIGPVISLLNHISEAMTLKYLGLGQISREKMLDEVKLD